MKEQNNESVLEPKQVILVLNNIQQMAVQKNHLNFYKTLSMNFNHLLINYLNYK